MKSAPSPAAEHQRRQRERISSRRYRQRAREGRWVVQFETWPELNDALEVAGFAPAGIDTREDVAAALRGFLQRWEISIDRLRPTDIVAPATHDGGNAGPVLDHDHDDDS